MTESTLPFSSLAAQGLNLQAVFDLRQLPVDVTDSLALDETEHPLYTQLLLFGHRGRQLWQMMQARGMCGEHPIDDFSRERMTQLFAGPLAGHHYRIVFPSSLPVGLQRLGVLAGWHHDSPFRVGINKEWGSWFAYRAVVVSNTALPLTVRQEASGSTLTLPLNRVQGRMKFQTIRRYIKRLVT